MVDVGGNYRNILDRIAEAAAKVRRDPREIKLLAAAKSQSVEAMRAAIAAGVMLIGENYVQEAADKKRLIADSVEWHMIGHLQRNKAKVAVELFDLWTNGQATELAAFGLMWTIVMTAIAVGSYLIAERAGVSVYGN